MDDHPSVQSAVVHPSCRLPVGLQANHAPYTMIAMRKGLASQSVAEKGQKTKMGPETKVGITGTWAISAEEEEIHEWNQHPLNQDFRRLLASSGNS